MKNVAKLIVLVFITISGVFHSCKKEEIPTLSTLTITNITATTASGGGNITSDGGAEVIARGACCGVNTNPTTSDLKTSDGTGEGQFVSALDGLNAGSTYYVRAYATNSVGTAYGADLSFTTLGNAPECVTQPATNITSSGATLNGTVNANDLSTTVTFEYGTTTSYGQTINATQSPVTGNSLTSITAELAGLSPGITYHFRVKSLNSLGTTNGNDLTFTTASTIPTITTTPVSNVTSNSALSGGNITSDGGAEVITRGVCWATIPNPTIDNDITIDGISTGNFITKINCLSDETTYYVRAYATNRIGTAYGDQKSFTTEISPIIFNPDLTYGSVSDIDGNCYKTIQIGDQTWMAENLKTTLLNDGSPIPLVTDSNVWAALELSSNQVAYCWYNNDIANKDIYGALYNASLSNVCPTGWHVSTPSDWFILLLTLDPDAVETESIQSNIAGNKLKESGINHWSAPNNSSNESGFTALPCGRRTDDGTFTDLGNLGFWWSHVNHYDIGSGETVHFGDCCRNAGYSIRCVKD